MPAGHHFRKLLNSLDRREDTIAILALIQGSYEILVLSIITDGAVICRPEAVTPSITWS